MILELETLLGSGKPWAVKRASILKESIEAYKSGDMSQDEYKEIIGDLVATDKLNAEADDINLKSMIITAVKTAMLL